MIVPPCGGGVHESPTIELHRPIRPAAAASDAVACVDDFAASEPNDAFSARRAVSRDAERPYRQRPSASDAGDLWALRLVPFACARSGPRAGGSLADCAYLRPIWASSTGSSLAGDVGARLAPDHAPQSCGARAARAGVRSVAVVDTGTDWTAWQRPCLLSLWRTVPGDTQGCTVLLSTLPSGSTSSPLTQRSGWRSMMTCVSQLCAALRAAIRCHRSQINAAQRAARHGYTLLSGPRCHRYTLLFSVTVTDKRGPQGCIFLDLWLARGTGGTQGSTGSGAVT